MSEYNKLLYKIITGIFICSFLLLLLVFNDNNQKFIFFMEGDHVFSDYFNVLMYISDNNPYFNTLNGCGEKVYFPITYLFMRLFTFGVDYSHMNMSDCLSNPTSLVSLMVFSSFSILVLIHSISKLSKDTSTWVLFSIFISSVFFFTIERGNLTLLSAAFICYFFAYKDSTNKLYRGWAIIALCLAAILKVYPALFGLFLLQEKRYKEILFCICFCLIFVFLPFVFFENGFDNIPQLISNLGENSMKRGFYYVFPRYSLSSTIYFITSRLQLPDNIIIVISSIARWLIYILSVISLFAFWYEKVLWKKIAILSFVVLELPVNSAIYCGMYLIPMIIYMFDKTKTNRTDIIYVIGISIVLCPLQVVFHKSTLTYHLSNIAIITMWIFALLEAFMPTINRSRYKSDDKCTSSMAC